MQSLKISLHLPVFYDLSKKFEKSTCTNSTTVVNAENQHLRAEIHSYGQLNNEDALQSTSPPRNILASSNYTTDNSYQHGAEKYKRDSPYNKNTREKLLCYAYQETESKNDSLDLQTYENATNNVKMEEIT